MLAAACCQPSTAPTSRTANVCPVNGTGVPGTGTETCAATPTSAAPPTTNAVVRASVGTRGATSSDSTSGRGRAAVIVIGSGPLVGDRVASAILLTGGGRTNDPRDKIDPT